jgi:hypothetical protein
VIDILANFSGSASLGVVPEPAAWVQAALAVALLWSVHRPFSMKRPKIKSYAFSVQ